MNHLIEKVARHIGVVRGNDGRYVNSQYTQHEREAMASAALSVIEAEIEAEGLEIQETWEHAIKRLNIPMLPSLRTKRF
jgi:hypothetical protein